MSSNPTFVNDMNIFGKHVKQIPCIVGEGSPTESTYGAVGCLYMDSSSNGGGEMWKCIKVEGTSYTWVKMISEDSGEKAVPDYWTEELDSKSAAIRRAMEAAGRNKSAFLWYTDAHWPNGSSKRSPALLKYLQVHTPMTKTNYGGDIVGDSLLATQEDMDYLYEWRSEIRGLLNHHSVPGNHDKFASDTVDYEDANYQYAFLLAAEESPDMVMGDGMYYYIDNPCERTRYLYLEYPGTVAEELLAQGEFIANALKSTPEGWHIVAIAHRWWQYSDASNPTIGGLGAFEADVLSVFDAYNARDSRPGSNYFYAQDFADDRGRVEFCIGGHIHVDYDIESSGGIPIIITAADANQDRVPDSTVDSGMVGTITESAVYGIVADYNDSDNIKITVVGVGRGTSRIVRKSTVKPVSISDITYDGDTTVGAAIDTAKFAFTVAYNNEKRDTVTRAASVYPTTIEAVGENEVTITYVESGVSLTGSMTIVGTAAPVANLFDKNDPDVLLGGRINSNGNAVYQADGQLVTGWIEGKAGDVFTVKSDKANTANNYVGATNCYNSGKMYISNLSTAHTTAVSMSDDGMTVVCTIPATLNGADYSATAYVRICVAYTDIDSIVITKA